MISSMPGEIIMKCKKFKFELGDRVGITGKVGLCVVTGRGKMDFLSGGELNMYQIQGGQGGFIQEEVLITKAEMALLNIPLLDFKS